MKRNRFDLPTDRMSTLDETGARVPITAAGVRGRYRQRRDWLQPALIVVFLVVPWVRVGGVPLFLLDIEHGRYALLGLAFGNHDTPLLVFVPVLFALGIALVTAVWGRFWCGWLCPQTVFIEAVFRRLDRKPPLVKWSTFFLVSLVLAHTFVAYFVGTDRLVTMMGRAPSDAPGWFLSMAAVTGIVLFDFGWFREQFCTIACPYGRMQAVLVDRYSRVVAYDTARGEPRRGSVPADATAKAPPAGDCVSCFRCVQVCPTGIDIRRGAGQLECIACTACIDACDEVMEKVGRPCGLIRFGSLEGMAGNRERTLRPRTILYATVLLATLGGLAAGLSRHRDVDVVFLRAVGAPYEEIRGASGPLVVNHFHAELWNGGSVAVKVSLVPSGDAAAKGVALLAAGLPVTVPAGGKIRQDFFVTFPPEVVAGGKGRTTLRWALASATGEKSGEEVLDLVGPLR